MKRTLLSVLVADFLIASLPAAAADGGMKWTGSASLGLRSVHDNSPDPSKLNEYRDLGNGVIGELEVRGRSDNYHFDGFLENPGRDDQYMDLRGGMYGMFKYRLYNNELRHNFGSGVATATTGMMKSSTTAVTSLLRAAPTTTAMASARTFSLSKNALNSLHIDMACLVK